MGWPFRIMYNKHRRFPRNYEWEAILSHPVGWEVYKGTRYLKLYKDIPIGDPSRLIKALHVYLARTAWKLWYRGERIKKRSRHDE